jgi:phosphoenolpyruvate carboxykinase (GTP)
MWPGFGENLRVLKWIAARCDGKAEAVETPIGFVPRKQDLDINGLDMDTSTIETLLSIDPAAWRQEVDAIGKYLDEYGSRVPSALREELKSVAKRLEAANAA